LQRDRVDIFLPSDVSNDPVPTRLISDLRDRLRTTGDEGDLSAAPDEVPNERQSQAGRSSCYSYAKCFEVAIGCHC
jgi:hypothetical protein